MEPDVFMNLQNLKEIPFELPLLRLALQECQFAEKCLVYFGTLLHGMRAPRPSAGKVPTLVSISNAKVCLSPEDVLEPYDPHGNTGTIPAPNSLSRS